MFGGWEMAAVDIADDVEAAGGAAAAYVGMRGRMSLK